MSYADSSYPARLDPDTLDAETRRIAQAIADSPDGWPQAIVLRGQMQYLTPLRAVKETDQVLWQTK